MQHNGKTHREITIKSNNPDWTVRVASKLLVGKGRWEVHWSKEAVRIAFSDDAVTQLVRALTSPIIRYGIEQTGDACYANPNSLWHVWKSDSRFTDMLMTDELIERIQEEILTQVANGTEWNVSEWVSETSFFQDVFNSVALALEEEGKVAGQLQENGWV